MAGRVGWGVAAATWLHVWRGAQAGDPPDWDTWRTYEFAPLHADSYYEEFAARVASAEWLVGYEGNAFTQAGDPGQNLLSITAVHPMREDAVGQLLDQANAGWDVIEHLLEDGSIQQVDYQGRRYYLRNPRCQA